MPVSGFPLLSNPETPQSAVHVISSEARNLLLSTVTVSGKADSSSFLLGMTLFEHSQNEGRSIEPPQSPPGRIPGGIENDISGMLEPGFEVGSVEYVATERV
jgi:hypothetical protein